MIAELSAVRGTLRPVNPDPWKRLALEWPEVTVRFSDLGNRWEETRWEPSGPVIVLHSSLIQVQRRAAIAHACEHLDRGAPCGSLKAVIEARVVKATARYLLPDLDQLADAVAVYDLRRAAEELWVPWGILVDRLRGLTAAELELVAGRRNDAAA